MADESHSDECTNALDKLVYKPLVQRMCMMYCTDEA